MTLREMRDMTPAALSAAIESARKDLLKLRCQVALGDEVRPHQIKALRRDLARMLTVLREKQAASAPAPGGGK
ncbi:MAG: 50S ribosomal protein L29 [Planctomycetota bacterium]|nr:50S ribosomal protein L29 [Planctomycetota bacterium]